MISHFIKNKNELLKCSFARFPICLFFFLSRVSEIPEINEFMSFLILCACVCVWACVCHGVHIEIRRTTVGFGSLLPVCGYQNWDSGYQPGEQAPAPTKPFHWP